MMDKWSLMKPGALSTEAGAWAPFSGSSQYYGQPPEMSGGQTSFTGSLPSAGQPWSGGQTMMSHPLSMSRGRPMEMSSLAAMLGPMLGASSGMPGGLGMAQLGGMGSTMPGLADPNAAPGGLQQYAARGQMNPMMMMLMRMFSGMR